MKMTDNTGTFRVSTLATLTLVATAALAGCGTGEGGDALPDVNVKPAPEAHYLGALDTETNLATEELDARYERIIGDTSVAQATAAIVAYYHNAGTTYCVADLGQTTAWEEAIQPVDEYTVFAHHTELAPPTTSQANLAQTNAQADVLVDQLDVLPPKPVDDAIIECLNDRDSDYSPRLLEGVGSEEGLHEFLEPAVRAELAGLWADEREAALENIELTEDDVAGCLADKELPAEFDGLDDTAELDDYQDVVAEVIEEVPTVPVYGEAENKPWRAAVETEEALALAAWDCKAGAYTDAVKALTRAMDSFESAHADKIREVIAANGEILKTAKVLGWTPERPIGEAGLQEARP